MTRTQSPTRETSWPNQRRAKLRWRRAASMAHLLGVPAKRAGASPSPARGPATRRCDVGVLLGRGVAVERAQGVLGADLALAELLQRVAPFLLGGGHAAHLRGVVEAADHGGIGDVQGDLDVLDLALAADEGLDEVPLLLAQVGEPAGAEMAVHPGAAVAALHAHDLQLVAADGALAGHR